MPIWLRRTFAVLAALLAIAYAHQSLLTAEPFGRDWRVLAESARAVGGGRGSSGWFAPSATLDPGGAHPLTALSVNVGMSLWGEGGADPLGAVLPLRIGNLLLLLCAAFALGSFLRRLLLPWIGSEPAQAAGWSAGLLLALHPLLFPIVAEVSARGELLALAFSLASAALFLRGRQEYFHRDLVIAAVCAALAGLASELALALPPALAFAEYVSARRYRPRAVRLRTALTTFVVYGACVSLFVLVSLVRSGRAEMPAPLAELAALADARSFGALLPIALEKLGLLVLPVNGAALGLFGQAIAAALVLVALQPGLLAARTAPRLWSVLLAAWALALVAALAFHPATLVSSRNLASSSVLLLGVVAMCAGLAAASSALSGARRLLVPSVLALGFAFLAHGNSLPWVRASDALEALRAELVAARVTWGQDAELLVVDPPEPALGVDPLDGALPALADPVFEGRASSAQGGRVRGIARGAVPSFVRTEEFARLRESRLVFLLPGEPATAARPFAAYESRRAREVARPSPSTGQRKWIRDGRSPTLDLDPPTELALRLRGTSEADTARAPRMGWRSKDGGDGGGSERESEHGGTWVTSGPEPLAIFDLATSIDWITSERVTRIWSVEGWSAIVEAEVLPDLPALAGAEGASLAPREDGDDWRFDEPHLAFTPRADARREYRVTLFSSDDLAARTFAVEERGGALHCLGAAAIARTWSRRGPVSWALELVIDGVAVSRAAGRVEEARADAR